MFLRVLKVTLTAGFCLLAATGSADAFGRRQATNCYTPCDYYPHYPCSPCVVYRVSPPPEPLYGPYTNQLRVVKLGNGVIVEITEPTGIEHKATGLIQVIQTGPGEVKYEGYNKRLSNPGMPGAPIIWSIFLCPTKAGKTDVKVGFVLSNNTMQNVELKFDITP